MFAVLIGLAFVLKAPEEGWDEATLCAEAADYPHTLILIDNTDRLSASQSDKFRSLMASTLEKLPQGGRVTIFSLSGATSGARQPEISLCKPMQGRDANSLYQSPRMIENRFKEKFGAPLEDLFKELETGEIHSQSSIIEAIYEIYLYEISVAATGDINLIIFSDMIQHVEGYSHYRQRDFSYEYFLESKYGLDINETFKLNHELPLKSYTVSFHYLLRMDADDIQTIGHVRFWNTFFKSLGAQVDKLVRIR